MNNKGFAVWIVIAGLFALWLVHTGRLQSFAQWVKQPAPQSSGGTPTTTTAVVSGSGNAQQLAICAASVSQGIPDPSCVSSFWNTLNRPGDIITAITGGLIKF